MKMRDLSGQKFGRLTVIELAVKAANKRPHWKCLCECGNETVASSNNIVRGVTRSCGCFKIERQREGNIKHGQYGTGAHTSWMSMRQRCLNPNNPAFKSYGGRGISICERWELFENFYSDMGQRPPGLEIDRIEVNGNYEPGNCRWATVLEQGRNQRKTRFVTINGVTKCMSEWISEFGINRTTLESRLRLGWPVEKALTHPKVGHGGRPKKAFGEICA